MVFILKNFVLWGVGPVLGLFSLLALALAGVRVLTARRWPPTWQLFIIAWPAFHLVYYGICVHQDDALHGARLSLHGTAGRRTAL